MGSLVPSSELAVQSWNAPLLPAESVPALAKVQQMYVEAIKRIQKGIHSEQEDLEIRLQSAHGDQGAKLKERERLQEAYQQKLLEPELVPERSPHRQKARTYLARDGIQALPFYMLVDFAEEVDNQSPLAGGIEQALADAGLLDALVVLPEAVATMDVCCAVHGLNDCRLDWQRLTGKQGINQFLPALTRLLRVDPTLSESIEEKASAWCETAYLLLESLQATSAPSEENLNCWAHGLLSGTVGTGEARCIGKATRVRAQQQELARLREREALLAQELEV